MNPSHMPKPTLNASEPQEHLPALGTGYTQEIDIAGFRVSLTLIYIIAGVGIPLIIIIILLVTIMIYRRRYPVRMRFGRKFSTFENPMYVSKDAQHPRELKRLTNWILFGRDLCCSWMAALWFEQIFIYHIWVRYLDFDITDF